MEIRKIINELQKELTERGFSRVNKTRWELKAAQARFQVDYISGAMPAIMAGWQTNQQVEGIDWKKDLTWFDVDTNTWETRMAIDNMLVMVDKYLKVSV